MSIHSGQIYQYVFEPTTPPPKKPPELPPVLNLLPRQRARFWTLVSEIDKANIRLVCKAFKNDIDTKVGMSVILDERKFHSEGTSTNLPPSASKIFIWGSQFTSDYVNRILLNSRLITSVSFSGPIYLSNFTKIMTRCPNLSEIVISDRSELDEKLHIPLKIISIQRLHIGAEGQVIDYSPDSNPTPTPWSTYSDILNNVTFPCLKILNIEYTSPIIMSENNPALFGDIINGIFKYLITHQKSITDLILRLHKSQISLKGLTEPNEEFEIDFPTEQLKDIRLKKLVADTSKDVFKVWDLLFPVQNSLEWFECLNQNRNWCYFSYIIRNNSGTLKTLKIRGLCPLTVIGGRIDLGTFKACYKLENLFLSRFKNSTQEVCFRATASHSQYPFLDQVSTKLPELVNLMDLPSSLRILKIQGLTAKTEELTWIPTKLKNLRVLELQLLGFRGPGDNRLIGNVPPPRDSSRHGLGVTSAVMKDILGNLRKLDSVFIEEFYNNRTFLKPPVLQKAIKEINLIPGENVLKLQGYFGVLIDSKEPFYDHEVPREERNDLWDIRFNQYRYQAWMQEKLDKENNDKPNFLK